MTRRSLSHLYLPIAAAALGSMLLVGCGQPAADRGTPPAKVGGRPANLGAKDPSADTPPAQGTRPSGGVGGK